MKVMVYWRKWGRKSYETMYLRGWRHAQAWLEYTFMEHPEIVEAGYYHHSWGKVSFKIDEEDVEPPFECLKR